jgi:hypothetical protein
MPPSPSSDRNTKNKRKQPPTNDTRARKRAKIVDARTISNQTTEKAFSNGELNVDKFVKAREYEIKALEEGLKSSKHGLVTRAHQEVPKEMRRRTSSHDVKRVPKRLRKRAIREVRIYYVRLSYAYANHSRWSKTIHQLWPLEEGSLPQKYAYASRLRNVYRP